MANEQSAPIPRQPWSVRAIRWLLLGQTAVLAGFVAWRTVVIYRNGAAVAAAGFAQFAGRLAGTAAYAALALLALFAAIAFFRLWRQAWTYAVLMQGLLLAILLVEYYRQGAFIIYPLMVYAIFMVVYLHHPDVKATFQVSAEDEDDEPL